jgi:hypothetical protein
MSTIKTKRDSLESYLREQIIGPGAGRNRIIKISDEFDYLFLSNSLLENSSEALSVVPGIYYSSGILFPSVQKSKVLDDKNKIDTIDEIVEEVGGDLLDDLDDNNILEERIVENDEDLQMDQMYPKNVGFTFCMDKFDLKNSGFELNISARHYNRVIDDNISQYGIRLELDKGLFTEILNEPLLEEFGTLGQYFVIIESGGYCFLKQVLSFPLIPVLDSNSDPVIKDGKQILKSENLIKRANNLMGRIYFLKNRNLFPDDFDIHGVVTIDSLLQNISNKLFNKSIEFDEQNILYNASQELEDLQNVLSHFTDANEIFSGRYGIWQSQSIIEKIKIRGLEIVNNLKTIYSGSKLKGAEFFSINEDPISSLDKIINIPINDNESASLSINIQLSSDSRNNNNLIYCKIQLLNTSSPFVPSENSYLSLASEEVNKRSFFGVECKVYSEKLHPYNLKNSESVIDDKEAASIQFLYRKFKDYAVGHGCSVTWGIDGINYVKTEYMPSCETPDVDSIPRDLSKLPINGEAPEFLENKKIQQIKYLSSLSDASDKSIYDGLIEFVESYKIWIDQKQVFADAIINENDREVANIEIEKCINDYVRLKTNVQTYLKEGSANLKKFRLMNSSMFIQMWHGRYSGSDTLKVLMEAESFTGFNAEFYNLQSDFLFVEGKSASWRAFQLAFILLNLESIFDDNNSNENRNELVDLVWFPTGGGKTEAYLGLISLTILHRRINYGSDGGGTSAIMRYTLRLLTLQQFQRASKLIIALELIRRGKNSFKVDLGEEPIRIGLYVGDNQIPNRTSDLIKEIEKLNNGNPSKIPFDDCICCGSKIKGITEILPKNINNKYNHNLARLVCTNKKCAMILPIGRDMINRPDMGFFPILLSDESIYQHPPALLFGTVDKFAQLAHKVNNKNDGRDKDSRRLFGRGNWEEYKPRNGYLPPDLIIQDELHLLLGPLGTGVALFESAFEQLCTRPDGTKPKVISSTATTRNTKLQIEALFNKSLNIFPKQGIDCDDSFFGIYKRNYFGAETSEYNYDSKRKYIGFLPTGRTQVWMQMRISALCLTHRALFELENNFGTTLVPDFSAEFIKAQNYFYSVVSYFNSVKEVGRTQAQVQTYILKEVRKVLNRSMRSQKLLKTMYAMKNKLVEAELTGRLTGEEVKRTLFKVEKDWTPNRFPIKDGDEIIPQYNLIPEFIVATNMISVGLDVSRFNIIIMNSMPRNTAEYIQASSRVARNDLGLVLTIHHPFKSRDLSHYEKFIEFHEKMYSYVEPISITPFTQKSVDKFMPLYVATIIRHFCEDFSDRNTAHNITSESVDRLIQLCLKYFNERFARIQSDQDESTQQILTQIDLEYIESWIEEAIKSWLTGKDKADFDNLKLVFSNANLGNANGEVDLYSQLNNLNIKEYQKKWEVGMSLRNIEPSAAIHINKY